MRNRSPRLRLLLAALGLGAAVPVWACLPAPPGPLPSSEGEAVRELRRWTERAEQLGWLAAATDSHPWLPPGTPRSALVQEKQRLLAAGDPAGSARVAAVLASEAQVRAARVLGRWVGRVDPRSGLLPRGVAPEDRVWDYRNAASDLYPHLLIAAALLQAPSYPPLLGVLESERTLAGPGQVPADVDLAAGRPKGEEGPPERIFGAVEYAKDALLPLAERLGPGPWLDRMQELARAVNVAAPTQTRFGRIASDSNEVNGQLLQVLSRLYWASGDDAYRAAGARLARAYLELALPGTDWIPTRRWNFKDEEISSTHVQLADHGNEIVAGLVEYHLVESARGDPRVAAHRVAIRALLDRLLEVGRTPDGLWREAFDLRTGAGIGRERSDNWGYLYAAYLTQALVEETWPGGNPEVAARYRAAARTGLLAAAALELYPWQGAEQDGYADAIESALYLLNRLPSPEAAAWVDRQAGTLFGAQDAEGRVEDRYLDGNFVRTALLYAAWQTRGARLDPWTPQAMLGAAPDGGCLVLALAASHPWSGRLVFDAPRHRLHLRLPLNYPRLNEWPEWFVAEPARRYQIEDSGGLAGAYDGAVLGAGLALTLPPGTERRLRICPTA